MGLIAYCCPTAFLSTTSINSRPTERQEQLLSILSDWNIYRLDLHGARWLAEIAGDCRWQPWKFNMVELWKLGAKCWQQSLTCPGDSQQLKYKHACTSHAFGRTWAQSCDCWLLKYEPGLIHPCLTCSMPHLIHHNYLRNIYQLGCPRIRNLYCQT